MKKIFVLCALFALFIGVCFGVEEYVSVGLGVYKDGSKAFIIDVVPNSSSDRAGIKPTCEIVEINGEKTKRLSIDEINSLLSGLQNTDVELVIKNDGKKSYVLKREKNNDNRVILDDNFVYYWSKISPKKYVYAHNLLNSPKYSSTLRLEVRVNNYWVQKRESFERKYKLCRQLSEEGFGACINDIIEKTKAQVKNEQTSLFQEERNQRVIRETVREIEMNLDEQNFQNQMMKMYLGI